MYTVAKFYLQKL